MHGYQVLHNLLRDICSAGSYCTARRCAASSGQRQRRWQMLRRRLYFVPAPAKTAAFTGTYIFIVGLAVIAAPRSCFGLLFDAR